MRSSFFLPIPKFPKPLLCQDCQLHCAGFAFLLYEYSIQYTYGVSSTVTIATNGATPSITISSDGYPIIAYRRTYDLEVAHCDNFYCGSSTIYVLYSGDVRYTSIATGSDGNPVISFGDFTLDQLKLTHCTTPNCSSSTTTVVDSSVNTGKYNSLVIGSDGSPIISYQEAINNDLKVAHCETLNCTSSTIQLVDSADGVYGDTSIAIRNNSLPFIIYHTMAGSDILKGVSCYNIDCTSGGLFPVDTTSNRGQWNSMVLGSDGFLVFSYTDSINNNLMVGHCSNVNCTSNTKTIIDSIGDDSGNPNAITIGANSYPVVAYLQGYPTPNYVSILKVAECNNYDCTSKNIMTLENITYFFNYEQIGIALGSDNKILISYFDNGADALKVFYMGCPRGHNWKF